jgi:hypothetical protein
VILGQVYFDANGNHVMDAGDPPRGALGVRLVARGTRDTVARAMSNALGVYAIVGVPVGDYQVVVDTSSLGDSMRVVQVDTVFRLHPRDSTVLRIGVSFPTFPVQAARALPTGRQIFIEGVALNPVTLFGDTTVHVADATGTIRATRVRATQVPYGAGDSVRLLGRRSTRAGQPVLDDVTVFFLGAGLGPTAQPVTTTEAAFGVGGLDARLLRISNATIADTAHNARGDFQLTVNDGSGPLTVLLDADAHLNITPFRPTFTMTGVGLLVPTGTGAFILKPRFDTDLLP